MTRAEYLEYHRNSCNKMVEITGRKNADYTGGAEADFAFTNFTEGETLGIGSTEQGFLFRMSDKFARIRAFVKKGVLKVKDESVEDTLLDLANYCILMAGYIRWKKESDALFNGPHDDDTRNIMIANPSNEYKVSVAGTGGSGPL